MEHMQLFEKGGVMMIFITALSVYVVAVISYKLVSLARAGVLGQQYLKCIAALESGTMQTAQDALKDANGLVPKLLQESLEIKRVTESTEALQAKLLLMGTYAVKRLESHLRGLELAFNVAPLLGLLGTVIGLIDSFSKLGIAGTRVDPSLLAGGIWEALLTTAAGLAVAIVAFAAYHAFDAIVERARFAIQKGCTLVLHLENNSSSYDSKTESVNVKLISPAHVRP